MNIYCIRDRMLDYFQDPFTAPNDYTVQASVSAAINNPEATSALAQAPHHFEIWRIATVDDQGNIRESREFIADASSLVRRQSAEAGARPTQETAPRETRSLSSSTAAQAAIQQAIGNKAPPEAPAPRT